MSGIDGDDEIRRLGQGEREATQKDTEEREMLHGIGPGFGEGLRMAESVRLEQVERDVCKAFVGLHDIDLHQGVSVDDGACDSGVELATAQHPFEVLAVFDGIEEGVGFVFSVADAEFVKVGPILSDNCGDIAKGIPVASAVISRRKAGDVGANDGVCRGRQGSKQNKGSSQMEKLCHKGWNN